MKMTEQIKEVMARTFAIPVDSIASTGSMNSIPQWDSLGHMELMLAIEERFSIKMTSAEMLEINSLPRIEALLASRQAD